MNWKMNFEYYELPKSKSVSYCDVIEDDFESLCYKLLLSLQNNERFESLSFNELTKLN